mmetsp:Transcript_25836/g.41547  ORF Transcript_25836/g.41547 Transcript_25836/m.41547 type:complete len:242 (+) Transcript_25836:402-1127(+)
MKSQGNNDGNVERGAKNEKCKEEETPMRDETRYSTSYDGLTLSIRNKDPRAPPVSPLNSISNFGPSGSHESLPPQVTHQVSLASRNSDTVSSVAMSDFRQQIEAPENSIASVNMSVNSSISDLSSISKVAYLSPKTPKSPSRSKSSKRDVSAEEPGELKNGSAISGNQKFKDRKSSHPFGNNSNRKHRKKNFWIWDGFAIKDGLLKKRSPGMLKVLLFDPNPLYLLQVFQITAMATKIFLS